MNNKVMPAWLCPQPIPRHKARRHTKDGLYEQLKADWVFKHPEASPEEYTAAMRDIAKRVRV